MLFLTESINLKPIDLTIYNYIDANLEKVIYMRIRDIAEATFVSTTTILRFCRKFGCKGYSDFKVRLQDYEKSQRLKTNLLHDLDSDMFMGFLKKMNSVEYDDLFQRASDMILQSDLLLFAGTGSSGIMANYGATLFSSLFTFSLSITDPLNIPVNYLPDQLKQHSCLIVMSVNGQNVSILDLINRMKDYPVHIISITNSADTPIAQVSDLNIPYYIDIEMVQDNNVTSQIPVMYILEHLSRLVMQKEVVQA